MAVMTGFFAATFFVACDKLATNFVAWLEWAPVNPERAGRKLPVANLHSVLVDR